MAAAAAERRERPARSWEDRAQAQAGCAATRPRRPLAAADEAAVQEAAEEAAADRAIEATGVCPTASRPEAGRTAALRSIRAAVPVRVPVASDPPAAGVVVGEAGAALTAEEDEAEAVAGEAGVASVPAAAAAVVLADLVPNATHRSASGTVPCPPPADRSPLAVCPRVEVEVAGLDPAAAAAVLHPPLPCPIGPVCTARHINGLNPLAERVRTRTSTSNSNSSSSKATTPSFVVAMVAAATVEEKGEATAHPVRQNNG